MGLTHQSTGRGVLAKQGHMSGAQRVVALAGNPNVGKSTVFNAPNRYEPAYRQLAGQDRRQRPGQLYLSRAIV